MNTKVNKTIFSGSDVVIPMASVQHIEKEKRNGNLVGINIITDKTKWNFQYDTWENAIWLSTNNNHAQDFLKAFSEFISERDGMKEIEKND